jgi:hypothetical protein
LQHELSKIQKEIDKIECTGKTRDELQRAITNYEQIISLEKRVCNDIFEKSVAEVDSLHVNANSHNVQNLLFNYCGIDLREDSMLR